MGNNVWGVSRPGKCFVRESQFAGLLGCRGGVRQGVRVIIMSRDDEGMKVSE